MAISKDKKHAIVAKLTEAFKEASSIAFVGFTKMSVASISKMRKELSQKDVKFFVAKKTLIRKALESEDYKGSVPELPGEVAIAWTEKDVTAPTRGIYEFGTKLKGTLTLLGAVFEGVFIDASQAQEIAIIPSTPVLRGMFVNVLNSPIQGLVIALDKIREKKV